MSKNEKLRAFLMRGIRDMIEKNREKYFVYEYAGAWYEKQILINDDLDEIDRLYEERENPVVEETAESAENEEPLSEEDEGSFNAQENPVETGAEE